MNKDVSKHTYSLYSLPPKFYVHLTIYMFQKYCPFRNCVFSTHGQIMWDRGSTKSIWEHLPYHTCVNEIAKTLKSFVTSRTWRAFSLINNPFTSFSKLLLHIPFCSPNWVWQYWIKQGLFLLRFPASSVSQHTNTKLKNQTLIM